MMQKDPHQLVHLEIHQLVSYGLQKRMSHKLLLRLRISFHISHLIKDAGWLDRNGFFSSVI